MMCWRRWHKWKREKRMFLTSTDDFSTASLSSSLSRKLPLPPNKALVFIAFSFYIVNSSTGDVCCCSCYVCVYAFLLLLHSYITWWNRRLNLSRSSFCLFSRVFRRCFFFPFSLLCLLDRKNEISGKHLSLEKIGA